MASPKKKWLRRRAAELAAQEEVAQPAPAPVPEAKPAPAAKPFVKPAVQVYQYLKNTNTPKQEGLKYTQN